MMAAIVTGARTDLGAAAVDVGLEHCHELLEPRLAADGPPSLSKARNTTHATVTLTTTATGSEDIFLLVAAALVYRNRQPRTFGACQPLVCFQGKFLAASPWAARRSRSVERCQCE